MPADAPLDPAWNPLRVMPTKDETQWTQNRYALNLDVQWIALPETSPWHMRMNHAGDLVLDPVADPELGAQGVRYGIDEIMARHGVNKPTAEKALRAFLALGNWDRWVDARHRDRLPPGTYAGVRAELEQTVPERYQLQNKIARRLHTETQIPFSALAQLVAALDQELVRLHKRAENFLQRGRDWDY